MLRKAEYFINLYICYCFDIKLDCQIATLKDYSYCRVNVPLNNNTVLQVVHQYILSCF